MRSSRWLALTHTYGTHTHGTTHLPSRAKVTKGHPDAQEGESQNPITRRPLRYSSLFTRSQPQTPHRLARPHLLASEIYTVTRESSMTIPHADQGPLCPSSCQTRASRAWIFFFYFPYFLQLSVRSLMTCMQVRMSSERFVTPETGFWG